MTLVSNTISLLLVEFSDQCLFIHSNVRYILSMFE